MTHARTHARTRNTRTHTPTHSCGTYSAAVSGKSKITTFVAWRKSSPRMDRSVVTSTCHRYRYRWDHMSRNGERRRRVWEGGGARRRSKGVGWRVLWRLLAGILPASAHSARAACHTQCRLHRTPPHHHRAGRTHAAEFELQAQNVPQRPRLFAGHNASSPPPPTYLARFGVHGRLRSCSRNIRRMRSARHERNAVQCKTPHHATTVSCDGQSRGSSATAGCRRCPLSPPAQGLNIQPTAVPVSNATRRDAPLVN